LAEREQEFEKQLKSLSRNIQNEQNPTRRKALEKEKQQLEDFRRKFQEKVDAFFTPYADLLNTPLDFFPPHPPERREPGRRGDGRGPMPGGEHRMPLMHARWKFQEMQDRIQRLESEVKQLRRRLDQLENTPDSSSGKDSSKNQDSSF
jgi:predicted  nucleic acid-binding Zn-ribbon protein